MQDPRNNVMPEFDSAAFQPIVDQMTTDGTTREQVIESLQDAWNANQAAKIAQWEEREEEAREQERVRQEEERLAREEEARRAEAEEQRLAEEQRALAAQEAQCMAANQNEPPTTPLKKKFRDFKEGSAVKSTPALGRPSSYALKKLTDLEYVEMWYFTVEACRETALSERSTTSEAFTMSNIDGVVAWKPLNAHKASSKAVPDSALTWDQVSLAKNKFLTCILEKSWPKKHVESLIGLYANLDSHSIREQEGGDQAVAQYHAEVRREWMDAVTGATAAEPFDIAEISEGRMQAIYAKQLTERQLSAIKRSVAPLVRV